MAKRFFMMLVFAASIIFLNACSAEKNYRGVSETKWQQLTAEQKQLIIDRSFADEVN